jgi:hypothetical protein
MGWEIGGQGRTDSRSESGQRQIGMDADLDTGAKRVCPEGEAQDAPSQPARRVRIGLGRSESQNAPAFWTRAVRPIGVRIA